jgi:triphosphoribosyl-dephospho-CoA synthase
MTGLEVAWAAQMACLYEVDADKPGNVSRRVDFGDARFEDFVASAVAIGPAFQDAGHAEVGDTILRAVADTRRLVATNTNLGIVLLLAPLAKAAATGDATAGLRGAVARVLDALTVADAQKTYEAIRLAAPAGMGRVERHDVSNGAVEATLREAMAVAQDRDAVAREYVTDFEVTFALGCETLRRLWREGHAFSDGIVTTFLTILAEVPDTLIARKNGPVVAAEVSRRAAEVLTAGGCLSVNGRAQLVELGRDLHDEGHRLNPGTTADLVSAALFVFLTEGAMLARVPALTARW